LGSIRAAPTVRLAVIDRCRAALEAGATFDSSGDRAGCTKKLKRLIRDAIRLRKRRDELFAFLRNADVPFDNNFGERSIRGAVIMRKNSFDNRSQKGAMTQSVLMSVFFTIKQRGLNPVDTVKKALEVYNIMRVALQSVMRRKRRDIGLKQPHV